MKPYSRRARPACSSAFTLIELVVSSALMAIVLGAAYACLHAGISTRRTIEPRSDNAQAARIALSLLTADLRAACPLHKGPEFLGTATPGNLDFATHHFTPRREGEGDYSCISWFIEADPVSGESVLYRRRNPGFAPDPLSGGRREEILRPVQDLTLEFYDGFEWFDSWGDANGEAKQANSFRPRPNLVGLPTAVRITLAVPGERIPSSSGNTATNAPPLLFNTVVRLEIETPASNTSSSTPSSPGNPNSPNPPNPFGP